MQRGKLTLAILLTGGIGIQAGAAVVWDGSTNGDWSVADNWTPSGAPDATSDVEFSNLGAAQPITTQNGNLTVKGITFTGTAPSYSIGGDNTTLLTLSTGGITLASGAANQSITKKVVISNLSTQSLTVTDAGQTLIFDNNFGGAAIVNKAGAGTVVLNNTLGGSGYNTTLDVDAGTIDLMGGNASLGGITGDATGLITNSGGNARTITAIRSGAYDGAITGNLKYSQGRSSFGDTGVQTFNGANTYTGVTNVYGGKLIVNGSHIGGGDYAVSGKTGGGNNNFTGTDGTLAGTGVIAPKSGSTVLVQGKDLSTLPTYDGDTPTISTGIIAPGDPNAANTVGALTLGSVAVPTAVTFGDLSRLAIELKSAGVSDQITVLGDLTLSGSSDELNIELLSGETFGGPYTLASYSGSLSGSFGSVYYNGVLDTDPTVELGSTGYRLDYGTGSDSTIRLVAIPEPAAAVMLGLAGVLGLGRRARRTAASKIGVQ